MSRENAANAFVWGYNNTGELGLGHAARVFRPAAARLPAGVVDLQGGANFSVAMTSSGQVWSWGSNEHGQLGDGSRRGRRLPQQVRLPDGAMVAAVAAGTDHVVVVTRRGELMAWGRNLHGQLGTGDREDRLSPSAVHAEPVRVVAAGDAISAAISTRGRLLTWGRNGADQLALKGAAPAGQDVLKPTRSTLVDTLVVAVDAGLRHLVVLTWDGRLLNFGVDAVGKPLTRQVPLQPAWGKVRTISAGEDHTLALTNRGLILGWGANDLGQLGVKDLQHRLTPVVVALPGACGRVTHLRAGHRHAVACTDQDEIFTWGEGRFGAVGVGRPKPDATRYPTPQRVLLPGVAPERLGGGGYSSAVFVDHGPAAALRLDPPTATVQPGRSVQYRIRSVDVFGTDLGPAPTAVSVTVPGGTVTGTTTRETVVTGRALGTYTVFARAGHLIGRAAFHVQKGTSR